MMMLTSLKMPRLCRKVSTVVGRSLCSECGPEVVGGGGGGGEREVEEEEEEEEVEGDRVGGDAARDLSQIHSSLD